MLRFPLRPSKAHSLPFLPDLKPPPQTQPCLYKPLAGLEAAAAWLWEQILSEVVDPAASTAYRPGLGRAE